MNTYNVKINGIDHTIQLSDDDAERMGISEGTELGAPAAGNAAGTEPVKPTAKAKAESPANKSRA